jgi:hypothetical protein
MELITLTIWGYITPGQVIPNEQAAAVLFGVAIVTAVVVWMAYASRKRKSTQTTPTVPLPQEPIPSVPMQLSSPKPSAKIHLSENNPSQPMSKQLSSSMFSRFTAIFIIFLSIASVSLASLVNMLPQALATAPFFALAVVAFSVSLYFMCRMLRNYVVAFEQKVNV